MKEMQYIPVQIILLFNIIFFGCNNNPQTDNTESAKPNIIFIMADDLGYGDLGCYGQSEIQTPNIDMLAATGLKLTNFYSGSPVCAPARSVLMTGLHTGHTTVRGNFGKGGVKGLGGGNGRVPLKDEDITLAELLKQAGYITGITGKWGLGEPNTTGLPNDQGFDEWFGFLNQRRAHDHYNDYIWKNKEKYEIPENKGDLEGVYTHNLFTEFSLDFIQRHSNSEKPFFLYVPYLLPHADYEIPEINPLYKDKDWSDNEKIHASMISLIDTDVGKIVSLLKEKGIEKNTIVFFTSDNGAAQRWEGRFDSSGKLRGRKRDVYEGGIRVPLIVAMPGTVPGGKENHSIGYFADMLPTLAGITNQKISQQTDGMDLTSVFFENAVIDNDRLLYWEFHEQGGKQAVRKGPWKAIRLDVHEKGFHNAIELYNLNDDPSEQIDLATQHPDIVTQMLTTMEQEHQPSENFPFRSETHPKTDN